MIVRKEYCERIAIVGRGLALLAALVCPGGQAECYSQDNARLYELEAYDLVTLQEGGVQLKVLPIDLKPRAPVANRQPDERFEVRLFDKPDRRFAVLWKDLVEIKLFEELLLNEANALVKSQRFDEAFEYLQVLESKYQSFPGVAESLQQAMFQEAAWWHKQGQSEQAIALLNEVHRRNPAYPNLGPALTGVVGRQIEAAMAQDRFVAARGLLEELSQKYADDPLVAKWTQQFTEKAGQALSEANEHQQAGRLREAYHSASRAVSWWPELPGARELLEDLHQKYPVLIVGVTQPTPQALSADARSWPQLRASRLLGRSLVEPASYGDSGVELASGCGQVTVEDEGRRLVCELSDGWFWSDGHPLSAADLAQQVLGLARDGQDPSTVAWRRLVSGVRIAAPNRLEIDLRRPHWRATAMLAMPMTPWNRPAGFVGNGPYLLESRDGHETHMRSNPRYAGPKAPFQEITERLFADGDELIQALRGGQVSVADRVRPWDVARLKSAEGIVVEPYAGPSVYFLVPNLTRPLPAQAQFRRAVAYGLDRESILKSDLGQGGKTEIGRLLTGPFPIGDASDPGVTPSPQDVGMALALAGAAVANLSADGATQIGPPASLPPVILAHAPTDVARVTCRAIQGQWPLSPLGLTLELREMPDDGPPVDGRYDFWLVEQTAPDPSLDAARWFGAGGLAHIPGPALEETLARLESTKDLSEVRRALQRVHRLAHRQMAVIPLWQLTQHLAYRNGLNGLGKAPVSLYQHLERWQNNQFSSGVKR